MSLSFPTSPTVGQMYNGLIWDGVKWANPQGPAGLANVVLEVQLNTIQTVTASVWNTCKYDTIVTDKQNAYVPSTGIFTPRQAGLYLVTATLSVNMVSGANIGTAILKNGSLTNAETVKTQFVNGAATVIGLSQVSALIACNGTTDNISVQGFGGGGITNFQPGSAAGAPVQMVATLLQVGPQGPAGTLTPGNRVLLSTVVISSPVATVDWLNTPGMFDGTYDELEMTIWNLLTVTAESIVFISVSPDGSTWDTGAFYQNMYNFGQSSNAQGGGGTTNQGGYNLFGSTNVPINTAYGCAGKWRFFLRDPRPSYMGQGVLTNTANNTMMTSGGQYTGAAGVCKGLRLRAQSGNNLVRGTIKLYGIAK